MIRLCFIILEYFMENFAALCSDVEGIYAEAGSTTVSAGTRSVIQQ